MRAATSIRAAVAALALAFAAVACQDDATPTKLADETREPTEPTGINPWAAIFAAAESRGGPVQISFAGGDESYRLGKLDSRWRLPEDDVLGAAAVCAIDDVANRRELDAFRMCMAQMLRQDVCRSGGVFVLYHPAAAPGGWRAACPVRQEEDDEREDESRVNHPA